MEKRGKMISQGSLSRVFVVAALIFSLILVRPFVIVAADGDPAAEEQESRRKKRFEIHGNSTSTFVLRSTRAFGDSVTDSDLFERIRLNVVVPGDDRYKFHFFGTLKVDLDGDRDKEAFYPFEDIDDARDSSWVWYVYDAHLDINKVNSYLKQVRVGRQASRRDHVVYFDGAAVDLALPRDVKLSVYGGRSVHFYEEDQGSDGLVGLGIDYSPLARTRLSLDYLYAKDEREVFSNEQNSFVALKVWQRLSSFSKVLVKYRMIDGKGKDIRIRSINSIRKFGVGVNVNYFRQVQDQRELSNELSLFHDVMGVSRPYHNMSVTLRKIWGERHGVNAGVSSRRLLDDDEASSFNREYDRYFVTYEVYGLPYDNMTVAITGDRWDGSNRTIDSLGLDVGYSSDSWRKGAEVNVGTYYSLYKYDYYFDPGEKTDIRTYYVKGKMPLRDNLTGSLRYEYEDAEEGYHIVKAELKYAF